MKQLLSVIDQASPILQAARKSTRLSQTELAHQLGVSQSRISSMELDPGSINLSQLLTMCVALNLELWVQSKENRVHQADDSKSTPLNEPEW
jgi:HTH-type transcriptional regulator/antitoxin HipB